MPGGAPKGNKNGAKPRLWYGAVRRTLAKDREALYKVAEQVVEKAKLGEAWAVTELRNTLDGKPKESVDINQTTTVVHVSDAETVESAIRAKLSQSVRTTVQ